MGEQIAAIWLSNYITVICYRVVILRAQGQPHRETAG